jgi:hypothetical protein
VAQLIKLQDFISRYEMNVYRYPSQYIRLKKQHWIRLKTLWENGLLTVPEPTPEQKNVQEKKSFFNPLRKKKDEEEINFEQAKPIQQEELTDDSGFSFEYQFGDQPIDEEDLKKKFLDQLLEIQIRWASSTIREKSFVNREFYEDQLLKYFLQRFPDNYLVLYQPVLLIQKAPVELDVIMISPIETWCITLVEGKENCVMIGSKDRFWIEKHTNEEKKILNPLIRLNRMEKIVQGIFQLNELELPIRKVVLNRTGYIDYPYGPADTMFVDKRDYEEWFAGLRRLSSPIKHDQLKAAKCLLQYCQTTYVKRPEWED